MKKLIYILIISSFIAANFLSIDMGNFQLSLYRVLIVLMAFLIIYQAKVKKIDILPKGKGKIIVLFYILWLIYSLISVIWVKDYYSWGRAIYFISAGTIGIICISMFIREKKDFIIVLYIIQIMVIIHNIIGWYEIVSLEYTYLSFSRLDSFSWVLRVGRNPSSMMGNTNNLALLLTFGVFISFICYKNSKNKLWKILSITTIGSCIILNYMTESRANLLGLIMALVVLLVVVLIKRKKIKIFLITILSITIIASVYTVIFIPTVYQRITSFLNVLNKSLFFNSADSSDAIRINLIKNGFVFLKQTYGFGTGAGNIEYWMASKSVYDTMLITNMHNWWMELLAGYGVLVFFGYLASYIIMAKGFFIAYMHNKDNFIQNLSLGLLCCLVAFLIGGVSSSSNITQEWLWTFWAVVIGAYSYIENTRSHLKL